MADAHANFAYSTVATAPTPTTTGTTLNVQTGDGAKFPTAPFNCTVWPSGAQPTYTGASSTTAEIIRVTSKGSGDDWTIVRLTEDASQLARDITVGDQIAATITAKTLTDIENNYVNSWSPYVSASAWTNLQTIGTSNLTGGTNSLFVFPISLQYPVKFNQLIMAQSLSYLMNSTAGVGSNSYYSLYGLYSMNTGSVLSLISASSYWIYESISNATITWSYPTTTVTSANGIANSSNVYGAAFPGGNLSGSASMVSYISGPRTVGLQFGGEMSLSGGMYWLGLLSLRSTGGASTTMGLSQAGLLGQIIHPSNMAGSVSGAFPFGVAPAEWVQKDHAISGYLGRHALGFITNTGRAGFGGTTMPSIISLADLEGVNTSGTVLPFVTLVST